MRTQRPSGLRSSRGQSMRIRRCSTCHRCNHGCSWESSNYAASHHSIRTHRLDRRTSHRRWRRTGHPTDRSSRTNRSGTLPCSRFRPRSLVRSVVSSNFRRADRRIGRRLQQLVRRTLHPTQSGSNMQNLVPRTLGCSSQACRSPRRLDARCSNFHSLAAKSPDQDSRAAMSTGHWQSQRTLRPR